MKEFVVEGYVNGMDMAVVIELDMPEDYTQEELVMAVLAKPVITDVETAISAFPSKFDVMAVYPAIKKPSLVAVEDEDNGV